MKKVITRFIAFRRKNILFDEIDSRVVDVFPAPTDALFDNEAQYAFYFQERVDIHDEGEVFYGDVKTVSPTYFRSGSVVETIEEAKRNPKVTPILIDNLNDNQWKKVIWTPNWSVYPFGDNDVLLTE